MLPQKFSIRAGILTGRCFQTVQNRQKFARFCAKFFEIFVYNFSQKMSKKLFWGGRGTLEHILSSVEDISEKKTVQYPIPIHHQSITHHVPVNTSWRVRPVLRSCSGVLLVTCFQTLKNRPKFVQFVRNSSSFFSLFCRRRCPKNSFKGTPNNKEYILSG